MLGMYCFGTPEFPNLLANPHRGDIATLRKICCTGLANNLSARISNRPKDEKTTWSLDKYNHTPATFFTGVRVLSDRATQIPDIPNSGSRQVVLRITSRQSTGKVKVPSTKKRAGAQNTTSWRLRILLRLQSSKTAPSTLSSRSSCGMVRSRNGAFGAIPRPPLLRIWIIRSLRLGCRLRIAWKP